MSGKVDIWRDRLEFGSHCRRLACWVMRCFGGICTFVWRSGEVADRICTVAFGDEASSEAKEDVQVHSGKRMRNKE
jgi:hypothetical protein